MIWTYIGVPIEDYSAIFERLKQYQTGVQQRWDKGNEWWELRACDYHNRFGEPKLIYPDIATACRFCLDEEGHFGSNTTYFVPGQDLYLLGILNSRVAQSYFTEVCAGLEGSGTTYLRFFGQYIQNFPVHRIKFSDPAEKARHDRMVSLVEHMLELHKRGPRTPQGQEMVKREIESADRAINQLVHELYELTEEEIRVVEGKV